MITLTRTFDFHEEACCSCGIAFLMPRVVYDNRKRDKGEFHCPNGHPQHYRTSAEDDLRAKLADVERELACVRIDRDAAVSRAERTERTLARLRTRRKT